MGGVCLCGSASKNGKIEKDLKAGKKPILWIVGGPGSGKGTQCTRLSEKYNLAHISTGDLLRDEVKSQSELGKKLNDMMMTGQLVPREIVLDLLKKAMISSYDGTKGFLIDGYPREVIQGKEFEEKIGPCTKIIYFEVSDAVMKERLLSRGKESGRVDDNEETILSRIKVFHDISEPVIQEFSGIVVKISGEQSPDDVFKGCCERFDEFM